MYMAFDALGAKLARQLIHFLDIWKDLAGIFVSFQSNIQKVSSTKCGTQSQRKSLVETRNVITK